MPQKEKKNYDKEFKREAVRLGFMNIAETSVDGLLPG